MPRVPRRTARALGTALMAYGVIGALLVALLAAAVAPVAGTFDTVLRSSADVQRTLTTTRDAFDGFSVSLAEARRSAARAANTARGTASTARQLADAMGISVFGARPLLPIATGFQQQSSDLEALATDLDALAISLQADEKDVSALRDQVSILRDRATLLGATAPATLPLVPLLYGMLAWLGVQALLAFWLGAALRFER